jgi:gluconate 5-dehydrogenase
VSISIDLFSFNGQVAVITGGGSGIGKLMAETLAEAGANIVVLGRNPEKVEQTAKEISNKYKVEAKGYSCDVTSKKAIDTVVESINQDFGHIDILINNAGTSDHGTFDTLDDDGWDKVMNTNLKSVFFMSQAVYPYMKNKKYGRIINTASVAGDVSLFFSSVYGTSKAGVIHQTKQLARELAQYNITVNAISPWFFETELAKKSLENEDFKSAVENRTPIKRIGKLDELKTSVLYFASKGSSYVTGQNIFVDGGMTTFGL